jgi:nicotinamidase-related amidase
MTLDARTVLLPIDVQRGFDDPSWPARNNPAMETNGQRLLAAWRERGWPIIHVRHDSVQPGSTLAPGHAGNAFRDGFESQPGEPIVSKSVNAAFIGTDLDLRLRRLQATAIVAFGISTDMCVSTTVRVGANLGWRMIVAGDACACFDLPAADGNGVVISADEIHRAHLATLAAEFARVASTQSLLDTIA